MLRLFEQVFIVEVIQGGLLFRAGLVLGDVPVPACFGGDAFIPYGILS